MIHQDVALLGDHRVPGGEYVPIDEVVMDQADPGVEQQRPIDLARAVGEDDTASVDEEMQEDMLSVADDETTGLDENALPEIDEDAADTLIKNED